MFSNHVRERLLRITLIIALSVGLTVSGVVPQLSAFPVNAEDSAENGLETVEQNETDDPEILVGTPEDKEGPNDAGLNDDGSESEGSEQTDTASDNASKETLASEEAKRSGLSTLSAAGGDNEEEGTGEGGSAKGEEGDTSGDYSQNITNPKLRQVIRILVNYYKEIHKDLYTDLIQNMPEFDPYTTDLTSLTELDQYNKAVSQNDIESFIFSVNLAPYSDIADQDLSNISMLKKADQIVLPYGITSIPSQAFFEMTRLNKVVMPDTVKTIGSSAFEKCESLYILRVYNKDGNDITIIGPSRDDHTADDVINLMYVEEIGMSAFASCVDIKSVALLGSYAEDTGGLSGDDEADSSTIWIKSNAFLSCTRLSSVDIPKGTLGTGVFENCLSLTSVSFDDSYTQIPDNTLQNIGNNAVIKLPLELKEIGTWALANNVIKEINLHYCKSLETIGEYAFRNSTLMASSIDGGGLENPLDLSGTSLMTIGHEAFAGVMLVRASEVILPDSVNRMGSSVFFSTSGVQRVNIPADMETIPAGTFMNSRQLKNIVIPEGSEVTSIGDHAFDLCGNLNDTEFLNDMKKLKSIGDYAFARCIPDSSVFTGDQGQEWMHEKYDQLKNVSLNSIQIPNSVTALGQSVFENDFFVSEVIIGNGIKTIPDRFLTCETKKSVTWQDVTLKDELTGKSYTYNFKSSTEPGYKNLRDSYSNYSDTLSNFSCLKSITMSDEVTSIGNEAFRGNTHLICLNDSADSKALILPRALISLGDYAFADCSYHSGSDKDLDEEGDNGLFITGISKVIIPDSITSGQEENDPIGEYAFSNDYSLRSVEFPAALKSIPAHCFDGCGYDDKYNDELGEHHYHGLTVISDIGNIESIGDYAFNKCYCLYQRIYDNEVTSSTDRLIEFGNKLNYLGQFAFAYTDIRRASSLSNTKIKEIKQGAFDNCRSLEMVYCPDTTESIGNYAFRNCPALNHINFPVYSTLSASMISESISVTLTPTLGRYRNAKYKVPINKTVSLPAKAFARSSTITISQVDPSDIEKSTEISEAIAAGDNYFTVDRKTDTFDITGNRMVDGTAVRISAVIPFTDCADKIMSVDYPVDVANIHADANTIAFDSSSFKVGSKAAGQLFDEDGEPVLYVSKNESGKALKLFAEAKSLLENGDVDENRGMITDDAEWEVLSGTSLVKIDGSDEQTTSTDKCTTAARFTISAEGEAVVRVLFGKGTDHEAVKTMKVSVVDAASTINYTIKSLGENNNPARFTIPLRDDEVILSDAHMDEERPWDAVLFTTSNQNVATIEKEEPLLPLLGKTKYILKAKSAGSATISMKTACAGASASFTVTVKIKTEDEDVPPTYIVIKPEGGGELPSELYLDEPLTFEAECLPEDSAQDVIWSLNSTSAASIEDAEGGKAIVTGLVPNSNVTIKATSAYSTLNKTHTIKVLERASSLEFRETPPVIEAEAAAKYFSLSSNQSQSAGIIRTPASSAEPVKFTSSDTSVLILGTSSSNCSENPVTISSTSGNLYYKGLKEGTAVINAETGGGKTASLEVKVVGSPIESITCLNNKLTLKRHETADMDIEVTPAASTETVTYSSNNANVATVDDSGRITAVGAGSATITVRSKIRNKTATCSVTVTDPVSSIDLVIDSLGDGHKNQNKLSMPLGQEDSFSASVAYAYDADQQEPVQYTSSDASVVTVDSDGNVKAVGAGTATITIKVPGSAKSKNVTVTVKGEDESVEPLFIDITGDTVSGTAGTVYIGEPATFRAVCLPAYASQEVNWTKSNSDAAELDSSTGDAVVSGVTPNGKVTITAVSKYTNVSGNLKIDVLERASSLEFRETPLVIEAGAEAKYFRLTSNQSQKSGIIRTPASSAEPVTFTSSDPSVLILGTSKLNCSEDPVTISNSTPDTLYYRSLKKGTAVITAATAGGESATLQVTVIGQKLGKLTCTNNKITLIAGNSAVMQLSKDPASSDDPITFTTSKAGVASVDASGRITAVGAGSATITAKSQVGGKSATCSVTVLGTGQSTSSNGSRYTVNADGTLTLTSPPSTGKSFVVPDAVEISGNWYPVTHIASKAFANRSQLKKVTIGANIISIGSKAFYNCKKLKTVTFKTKVLKTVGKKAFKTIKKGSRFKCPKAQKKKYKKLLKKSGMPKKGKVK